MYSACASYASPLHTLGRCHLNADCTMGTHAQRRGDVPLCAPRHGASLKCCIYTNILRAQPVTSCTIDSTGKHPGGTGPTLFLWLKRELCLALFTSQLEILHLCNLRTIAAISDRESPLGAMRNLFRMAILTYCWEFNYAWGLDYSTFYRNIGQ